MSRIDTGRSAYVKQSEQDGAADHAPDPEYVSALHSLPCVICDAFGEVQMSKTTVHHWIMGRAGTRRTPDRQALPLCDGHHQGMFDTSKVAIHREPKRWAERKACA